MAPFCSITQGREGVAGGKDYLAVAMSSLAVKAAGRMGLWRPAPLWGNSGAPVGQQAPTALFPSQL